MLNAIFVSSMNKETCHPPNQPHLSTIVNDRTVSITKGLACHPD